eukprot:gene23595-28577_t
MNVGALVEIFGLVAAKEHNGSVAKVLSEEEPRLDVQVLYGPQPKKQLSVKSTNLKPLSPALLKAVEGEELLAHNDVSGAAACALQAQTLRLDCGLAHSLRMRCLKRATPVDVMEVADATLNAVACCGLSSVPTGFAVAGAGDDGENTDESWAPLGSWGLTWVLGVLGTWVLGLLGSWGLTWALGLLGTWSLGLLGSWCYEVTRSEWPRKSSIVYTIALIATALREHIATSCAARGDGRFVLHLLGCRWHVEGSIDVELLSKLLGRVAHFNKLCLVFIGPELAGVDLFKFKFKVQASLKRLKRTTKDNEVEIKVIPLEADMLPAKGDFRLLAESSEERPDLAVILNGGLDDHFGSWALTLWRLLAQGSPAAFTGVFDKFELAGT